MGAVNLAERLHWGSVAPPADAYAKEAEGLAAELKQRIQGEVRFSDGDRALYAADLSMFRQVPVGVVVPRTVDDVVETVAACRSRGIPILGRGCGTSLAGQCCNVAVIIDFSKHLNRILEIDPESRTAWVEPGVICDQLRGEAEKHGLTWAPDPATHEYCTFGGMIGNNSCGVHSVMGGKTVDNIEELEILTYEGHRFHVGPADDAQIERVIREGGPRGTVYGELRDLRDRYADEIRRRFPDIPRRVSGYNLESLLPEYGFHVARALVGSEGTCVLVLRAKLRLIPSPPKRALVVIGYAHVGIAADQVPAIMDIKPIALEAVHQHVPENMARKGDPLAGAQLLPRGNAWLLVEFGGDTQDEASDLAREAMRRIDASGARHEGMKLIDDPGEQDAVWKVREAGVGASRVPGVEDAWPSWEDSAVSPEKLGAYLRDLIALIQRYDYAFTLFGHFGQGCIHSRIAFDTRTPEGVAAYRSFMEEASDLVVAYGGSLSGEHGDGQARGELLPKMFGSELVNAFREFKSIWDPAWKMNPGKVVDPYPLDSNLRMGPDYHPLPVLTHFQFPDDHGSLSRATERCFGVGKCRRLDEGTMCPSFMVLREEKHTTRGRAHLLFEMLRGETITDGWKSEAVKESLDFCLCCKGCKGDCPVNVDMATYKAEFLSHYYEGRVRPRSAYAFGLIHKWSRLAERAPAVANFLTQTPGLDRAAKWMAGMAPTRKIPAYASQSFRRWWAERPASPAHGRADSGAPRRRVLLWPDTFNNYFHPSTLQAGAEVLEHAGCDVAVPMQRLCCGRPLYDFGMLERAKRQLRDILDALRPDIRAGTPLVGLEPSCVAVFRDELVNLFPNDEDAQRLRAQTFTLGEFLMGQLDGYEPPKLDGKAVVHAHCHHRAIMKFTSEPQMLEAMGLDVNVLDSGCCGMAGSFGFEAGQKYEVSVRAGERVLLPAVRNAAQDTLVITDGFSCREQIAQLTNRRALHTAEVLQMALHHQRLGVEHAVPERLHERLRAPALARKTSPLIGAAAVGGALVLGGVALYALEAALGHGRRGG